MALSWTAKRAARRPRATTYCGESIAVTTTNGGRRNRIALTTVPFVSGTVLMFLWTPVGTKRALQPQTTYDLVGPKGLAERTAAIHRSPQRRQLGPRLRCIDLLHPVRQTPQGPGGQEFLADSLLPPMETSPAVAVRVPALRMSQGQPARRDSNGPFLPAQTKLGFFPADPLTNIPQVGLGDKIPAAKAVTFVRMRQTHPIGILFSPRGIAWRPHGRYT